VNRNPFDQYRDHHREAPTVKLHWLQVYVGILLAAAVQLVSVRAQTAMQSPQAKAISVTPDNFARAETDMYFAYFDKKGAFGKFFHLRDLPLEGTGVRPNRDTLYSEAVFDLDAGSVTITLPDAGKRFMSLLAINEDHYVVAVDYGAGPYTFTNDEVGTRYLFVALRTFVDPTDPKDFDQVHELQDAVRVNQPGGPGNFEAPSWDPASQKQVREALLTLSATLPDLRHAFGAKAQVDPTRHLIGTASAWGGNPEKDAIYLNVTPDKNDGTTVYKLTVPRNVPVNAFWSVIVYTADGHLQKNEYNAYSLNSITAKKNDDGSVTVQFGGCDGKIPNCLPIMNGWNYMVRLYRPRAEVLNDNWKFPDAEPVSQ
jgi:hypothetical protein